MDNIFLAIVTDDREYGRSLSLALLNVCRGFIIRIFTAEEYLELNGTFDLILWDGDEARVGYGGRIIYMAEKQSDIIMNYQEKRFCIYKYNSASNMVAVLFDIYEALTGKLAVNVKQQNVRLFAVASFMGGVGCSTVAMAISQEMCRFNGKKVFYLSFEEFESTGEFMKYDSSIKGANVYLYELFGNIYSSSLLGVSGSRTPFLEGRVIRDDFGIETFAPVGGRNPLREITCSEIDKFMASIIDSGRYDAIVIDMSTLMSKIGVKCLDMVEKICLVSSLREETARERHYISQLVSSLGEEVLTKVVKVVNKVSKNDKEKGGEDRGKLDQMTISLSSNFIKEEGYTKILLDGAFGNDIYKLTNKMMEPI